MPAELTLRRSWGRRRITPELVEDVNEWLDSRRPLLFLLSAAIRAEATGSSKKA
jgi:hypothetical protein